MLTLYVPYKDPSFREYLLGLLKANLTLRSKDFRSIIRYKGTEYTLKSLISGLYFAGDTIVFKEDILVAHLVYDLNQRFWLDIFRLFQSRIGNIYLHYRGL